MPGPTNPLRAGSCPAPPSVTIATLFAGLGFARHTIFADLIAMASPCAIAKPSSSSRVRSFGSLMNFFIGIVRPLSRDPLFPELEVLDRSAPVVDERRAHTLHGKEWLHDNFPACQRLVQVVHCKGHVWHRLQQLGHWTP